MTRLRSLTTAAMLLAASLHFAASTPNALVLEFDHRDQSTKRMPVSEMMRDYAWQQIALEIEKCDVRCANDHRRRTARQLGWRAAMAASVTLWMWRWSSRSTVGTAAGSLWLASTSRRRLRAKTLTDLLALSPVQFETEVGNLLRELGYRHVKRVGGAGDLAADITCRDQQGRSAIVQCKRYAPDSPIGSPTIQTFIGMISVNHGADRGLFVTTSKFTKPATALGQQHGIELIDGDKLSELVTRVYSGQLH